MKITNFRLIEKITHGSPYASAFHPSPPGAVRTSYRALVDVEEFSWLGFKRKKETREIYKWGLTTPWYFSDTGEFPADHQVEALERVLEAKEGKDLKDCKIEPRHAIKAVAQFLEAQKKDK